MVNSYKIRLHRSFSSFYSFSTLQTRQKDLCKITGKTLGVRNSSSFHLRQKYYKSKDLCGSIVEMKFKTFLLNNSLILEMIGNYKRFKCYVKFGLVCRV